MPRRRRMGMISSRELVRALPGGWEIIQERQGMENHPEERIPEIRIRLV